MLVSSVIRSFHVHTSKFQIIKELDKCVPKTLHINVRSFRTSNVSQVVNRNIFKRINDKICFLDASLNPGGRLLLGVGQAIATGTIIFGLGTFCHHGLGIGKGYKSFNGSNVSLPKYVQDRFNTTYAYFATSLFVTTVSATTFSRFLQNPVVNNIVMKHTMLFLLGTLATQMVITSVVSNLPYRKEFGMKQFLALCQVTITGMAMAPLYLISPVHSLLRVAYITTGGASALTALAILAPDGAFLSWQKPLTIVTTITVVSLLGLMLVPVPVHLPVYRLLYTVAMHGGVIAFSAKFFYNTHRLAFDAKIQSVDSQYFDPINESMKMYFDIINIYGRLAFIFPRSQYEKK